MILFIFFLINLKGENNLIVLLFLEYKIFLLKNFLILNYKK
jgi:hypothetical protein